MGDEITVVSFSITFRTKDYERNRERIGGTVNTLHSYFPRGTQKNEGNNQYDYGQRGSGHGRHADTSESGANLIGGSQGRPLSKDFRPNLCSGTRSARSDCESDTDVCALPKHLRMPPRLARKQRKNRKENVCEMAPPEESPRDGSAVSACSTRSILRDYGQMVIVKARVILSTMPGNGQKWVESVSTEISNAKTMSEIVILLLRHKKLDLPEGVYKFRLFVADDKYGNPQELLYSKFKESPLCNVYSGRSNLRSHKMIIDLTRKTVGGVMPKGCKPWRSFVRSEECSFSMEAHVESV